jgi:hypothetical protein
VLPPIGPSVNEPLSPNSELDLLLRAVMFINVTHGLTVPFGVPSVQDPAVNDEGETTDILAAAPDSTRDATPETDSDDAAVERTTRHKSKDRATVKIYYKVKGDRCVCLICQYDYSLFCPVDWLTHFPSERWHLLILG